MKKLSVLLVAVIIHIPMYVDSCTIIAVGKKASKDGSVIISHTDCGPDCRIRVVKGQTYPKGSTAPVYWGILDVINPLGQYGEVIGYIPQVEKTFSYIHSAYPHINEHQLAIGESTLSQREELKFKREGSKQIMTVEQAQMFALQRFTKARDAVKFIGELMSTYGFLPSCVDESEALCVADANEVWIIEIFGVGAGWDPASGKPGAIWVAQRMPDDHALVIANWSIIKEVHPEDTAHYIVSTNYKQFAIDKGWYDTKSGKPFIWQDIYAPLPREWATSRLWLFYSMYAPNYTTWPDRMLEEGDYMKGFDSYHQYVEPLSIYPFSVKPERPISVQDVMAFQRSAFEGTMYDFTADINWMVSDEKGGMVKSPLANPFPSKYWRELLHLVNRRMVARPQGYYGMIAQLRNWLPDPIGGIYWVFLDNAYTSPYVPIYAGINQTAECYQIYDPEKYDEKSACWAIDFVDNLLYLRFQQAIKDVWEVRNPFEEKSLAERDKIDQEALVLYKKDTEKAKQYLTKYTQDKMNEALSMYTELRNKLIVKYGNSTGK